MTPSPFSQSRLQRPATGVPGSARPRAPLGWGGVPGALPGVASARLVAGTLAIRPLHEGLAACGQPSTVGGGRGGGEPFYLDGCGCGGGCGSNAARTPTPQPPPVPPTRIEPPPSGGGGPPGGTGAPCTINCDKYSCDSGDIATVEAHCAGQGMCAVTCEYTLTARCTCALTTSCDACPDTTPPAPAEDSWH